jgi:amidohydrolase
MADQLSAWRRDFHQHPELGFQEVRTARVVAETLEELGIEVQTGIAKTGVVGYLGEGAPVVAIRADMDALPILESNDVPYASTNPGVMHACGHDAHTAILLGVAHLLASMPDRPAGQIRFLFQPSEEASDDENKSGGLRMVEEGVMDGVDAVIGLHIASDYASSRVMLASGPITAAADGFTATIIGTGGHGAYPHIGIDPIFLLAQVLNAINGIRARRIDPTRAGVISIGTLHAGTVGNVIPHEVTLSGTIRSFDDETRARLLSELETALGVTRALGGDYRLEVRPGYPSTINDARVVDLVNEVVLDLLGNEGLLPPEAGMGAEDFSYMSRRAPAAFFNLGAALGDKSRPHHTPVFDISEAALPTGAAVLAESACRLLTRLGAGTL